MPRKTEFTQDAILEAAIAALSKTNLSLLTVREVAKELKSSTAPVYQQFGSMPELIEALLGRIAQMLASSCRQPRSDRAFLDIGMGYVLFARDNPRLFSALFLEKHGHRAAVDQFFSDTKTRMKQDGRFASLEKHLQEVLYAEMWIYSHGLATMIISGIITQSSDKAIYERLDRMGKVVIPSVLAQSKNARK